jgi:hypothetical protein
LTTIIHPIDWAENSDSQGDSLQSPPAGGP